jgi:hypothetical protein
LRALRRVRTLNPREPLVPEVQARIRSGKRVSQAAVDRLFVYRTGTLTGVRQR